MRLALFEPDIPQNTGALLRLGACLGVAIDIIGPCGFVLSDLDLAILHHHDSWAAFRAQAGGRLLLLTTQGDLPYHRFRFRADDTLLLGRESAGVPEAVHRAADARLRIPIRGETRSLNMALAAAMVLGEALRQTEQFAGEAR
jgi:tRNA (cytidine/uridine-2'-O-)-methyltransferase